MLVHEGANRLIVEDALRLEGGFAQQVFHEGPHAAAQPLCHRNLETAFVAVQDFIGQQLGKSLFEQPLAFEAVQLPAHRQARCKLRRVLVKERRANLQAVQHGAAIHLDQDIIKHELAGIYVESAGKRRGGVLRLPVVIVFARGGKENFGSQKAGLLRLESAVQNGFLHVGRKGREHGLHPLPCRGMRCPQECGNGQAGVDVPRRGRQQLRERFYDALAQCRGGSIVPLGNLEADIMFIACPQFVRAVAAKSHSDLFARDAGKQPCGGYGRISHGHVHAADDAGQGIRTFLGGKHAFMVVGGEGLGHDAGIARLIVAGLAEADRKCLDGRGRLAGHEPRHNGRVNAAGKKDAQRHIADHAAAHGP